MWGGTENNRHLNETQSQVARMQGKAPPLI